ncbi:MAG TPA: hypothetical protein DEB40_07735 [Elusimicrobia bacterium]|nr:hypothetical protein [Elusimicrobiota bacterium]HBT61619.1 hypothetical protein [Elusimicrobiota bacterium]
MLRKWFVVCLACASLAGAPAPAAPSIDFDQGVDVKGVIESVKARIAQQTAAEKARSGEWTIMVYVNAKNNLEKYGLGDVNEMEKIGSSGKVKIAVELGRINGYDASDGNWTGQRRYIIKKDKEPAKITSPVLQNIAQADMGDWRHLVDFVQWAKKAAPAKHYMLIVWNHGSGWDKRRYPEVVINGISYDDETGNNISTMDLGQAMARSGKIDIYASDACLMQMAEVAYQVKDFAEYIVGSEETEPGDGYTYDALLKPLTSRPAMTPAALARLTAEAYTAHYARAGEGATQSAVKAAALPKLLSLLSDWADAVTAANETAVLKNARSQAQAFTTNDNKDLLHFIRLVDRGTKDPQVKSKGAQLEKHLAGEVIMANATTGDAFKNAFGLAIYIPSSSYNEDYEKLAWAKEGSWTRFVQWQRHIRDEDEAQASR